jgi:hypothetical protein
MTRTRTLAILLTLALCGVVRDVARGDVSAGEHRTIQAREGAVVRSDAKALASRVARLPFNSRVDVLEVRGAWARVGGDGGATGWVRVSDLVEPGALTSTAAVGTGTSAADVSLAGRQFDGTTEQELRATEADLARAFPLVDAIEHQTVKPDSKELEQFIAEGRLGLGK